MTTQSLQTPTNNKTAPQATKTSQTLPTFLDHIQELRSRLFWVALCFVATSAAAYPFKDQIIQLLTSPLGGQQLFYLTPIGGFSFIIKICTYVGILFAIPIMVYHLYRYLEPVMGVKRKSVVFYTFFSTVLAGAGASFAYLVSLPAALHFLTNFGVERVTAMLTVDAYLSFVVTYLIGAALLFQVPLVMLIINSITPIPPSKLMGYQRYVLLGAFIAAAIISPTPDVTNQALLAVPIIMMYQFGVVLVWIRNSMSSSNKKKKYPNVTYVNAAPVDPEFAAIDLAIEQLTRGITRSVPAKPAHTPRVASQTITVQKYPVAAKAPQASVPALSSQVIAPRSVQDRPLASRSRPPARPLPALTRNTSRTQSVDGFAPRAGVLA